MSLVNEMLKELQKNRSANHDIKGLVCPTETKTSLHIFWLSGVLLLLIIFIIYKPIFTNNLKTTKNLITPRIFAGLPKKLDPHIKSIDTQLKLVIDTKPEITFIVKPTIKTQRSKESVQEPIIKIINEKENKENDKPISLSRLSIAKKKLLVIFNQWHLQQSKRKLDQLLSTLNAYQDLPEIWNSALFFLKKIDLQTYQLLLTRSIQKFPNNIDFSVMSAKHHFKLGNIDQAFQYLNNIKEKKRDQRVYRLLGMILQKQNKHPQAITNYKKSLLLSPNSGEIHMAIAISFEALDQSNQAIDHFISAIKDNNLSKLQQQFIKQRLIAYQG